jgi:hypothetical protein
MRPPYDLPPAKSAHPEVSSRPDEMPAPPLALPWVDPADWSLVPYRELEAQRRYATPARPLAMAAMNG